MLHDGQDMKQTNTPLVTTGFNLWFPKNDRQRVLWNSTVRLSQEYFDDLKKHAVSYTKPNSVTRRTPRWRMFAWLARLNR